MTVKQRIAKQRQRREYRVRNRAKKTALPRLSVRRSSKHIYAQLIDDVEGRTLASASTVESGLGGAGTNGGNVESAKKVGAAIAQRAVEAGVSKVQFDRGQYRYHGRVAALADAAREGGLKF